MNITKANVVLDKLLPVIKVVALFLLGGIVGFLIRSFL